MIGDRHAGDWAVDDDVVGEAGDFDVGAVEEVLIVESGQGGGHNVGYDSVGECAGVFDALSEAAPQCKLLGAAVVGDYAGD